MMVVDIAEEVHMATGNKPDFNAFVSVKGKDDKNFYSKIGCAWHVALGRHFDQAPVAADRRRSGALPLSRARLRHPPGTNVSGVYCALILRVLASIVAEGNRDG